MFAWHKKAPNIDHQQPETTAAAAHAGSLLLGYGLCRILGQPRPAARSAGIQSSMRNSALAGQLAVAAFPAHPAAALPCVLSACVHTVLGTLAALYFKAQDGAADGQGAAAAAAGEQHSHGSSSSGGSGGGESGSGGGGSGGPPGGPEEPFSALLEAVEMVARQVAPLAQRASEQLAPLAAAASSTLTAARTTTRAGVHAALQAGASLLVPGLMEELEGQLKGLEQAELDAPPQEERERGRPGAKVREATLAVHTWFAQASGARPLCAVRTNVSRAPLALAVVCTCRHTCFPALVSLSCPGACL